MSTFMSSPYSPAISQAARNLGRWHDRLATARQALAEAPVLAQRLYPELHMEALRRGYVRAAENRVERMSEAVAEARKKLAAERASAFLESVEPGPGVGWLGELVGNLMGWLVRRLPSRQAGYETY